MSTSRPRLTPTRQRLICSFLRSGSYPFVAAEAAGIPRERFIYWMNNRKPFREAVLAAMAEARLTAESKVFATNPLAWLKHGPGKETPEAAGWTNPSRGPATTGKDGGKLLDRPDVQRWLKTLLEVLEPYPEVKLKVAESFAALEKE
jgi:hypothetical protein